MYIRYCPICSDELWHGTKSQLNLYGCPTCGNIFKIQPVESKPIEEAEIVKIPMIKEE